MMMTFLFTSYYASSSAGFGFEPITKHSSFLSLLSLHVKKKKKSQVCNVVDKALFFFSLIEKKGKRKVSSCPQIFNCKSFFFYLTFVCYPYSL